VRLGDAAGAVRVLTTAGARPAELRRQVVARLVDQPGRPRRPSLDLAVTVAPGDSGAPVLDADGAVVGVVYARSTRRDGTAYAVRGEGLRRLAR
jgi:S1-C subfamily serine protease